MCIHRVPKRDESKKTGDFRVPESCSVSHSPASSCSETRDHLHPISTAELCSASRTSVASHLGFPLLGQRLWSQAFPPQAGRCSQGKGKVFVGKKSNGEARSWDTFCWDLLKAGKPLEKLKGSPNDLKVIFKGVNPHFSQGKKKKKKEKKSFPGSCKAGISLATCFAITTGQLTVTTSPCQFSLLCNSTLISAAWYVY